jgi:hypothetical protein
MAQLEKRSSKVESQEQVRFGEDLGQLIHYCTAPFEFLGISHPRAKQPTACREALELIARDERNTDQFKTKDAEQLTERLRLAELDLVALGGWSLWETFKYITRLVVDRELTDLRADSITSRIGTSFPGQFEHIHKLIREQGIVNSIVECDGDISSWMKMCFDPEGLWGAYEANEAFEKNRGCDPEPEGRVG